MWIVFLWIFGIGTAQAELDPRLLAHMSGTDRADILVSFQSQVDLSRSESIYSRVERLRFVHEALFQDAERAQRRAIQLLQAKRAKFRSFHVVNAVAVAQADLSLLYALDEIPEVKAIRADELALLELPREEEATPNSELLEGIQAVGADRVWSEFGVRGEGIVIAGQDSGFDWTHPALARQYRGGEGRKAQHDYNWHSAIHYKGSSFCDADAREPCDDTGHGTHTMGTMVGDDGAENAIGVAPGAQWIGCRSMNMGSGTVSSYLECFDYFLAPYPLGGDGMAGRRPDLAPHIINNSWTCPPSEGCGGPELLEAIRSLRAAGILVVAAVGNYGPECGSAARPPGYYSGELLSVGAYYPRTGEIASFSSRGPSPWNGGPGPNLAAPGRYVYSSVPERLGKGLYVKKSGTSMAAPHVAGVVALLWSARPSLVGKVRETMEILERSATPKRSEQSCGPYPGDQVPNAVFGYGLVNAFEAIRFAARLGY